MELMVEAARIPLLAVTDAVVFGGSFAGIAAALELAAAGQRVWIIEPRTYMGREMTATLRPWLKAGGEDRWPKLIRYVLAGQDTSIGRNADGQLSDPTEAGAVTGTGRSEEIALQPDLVKRRLEQALEEAGVGLLYATLPVAVDRTAGGICGVIVANKSGRQRISCRLVVDATETALAASLCGQDVSHAFEALSVLGEPASAADVPVVSNRSASASDFTGLSGTDGDLRNRHGQGQKALFTRTLEFTGVSEAGLRWLASVESVESDENAVTPLCPRLLPVPAALELAGNTVRLHPGYRGAGHWLVEYAVVLPAANTLEAAGKREMHARMRGMALAEHLLQQVRAFAGAVLCASSHELSGPYPVPESSGQESVFPADWGGKRAVDPVGSTPPAEELEIPAAPMQTAASEFRPVESGIWSLWLTADRDGLVSLHDPSGAARLGERLAEQIVRESRDEIETQVPSQAIAQADAVPGVSGGRLAQFRPGPTAGLTVRIPAWLDGEAGLAAAEAAAMPIPVAASVDVLVAGGGSSGACAAITAAKEDMRTLLVDLNPGLGGTGTYGGVDSYWFGRKTGFAAGIQDQVLEQQRKLRYKGNKWSIEAKMHALLTEAEKHGAELMLNSIVFGAVMDGTAASGLVAATRYGPVAVLAQAVIDATGDGDAAACAGAEYVYGSARDHTVMWYSLAQYRSPDKIQNNFTSMVDVSNILDYTRAILAGRRRGGECHDHGIYVATRESRHILGDVVMKLSDQLLHRRWEDVVNIHFSNHDVKGVSGADWVNVGLIPPNLEIEIPYRMLLPKGIDGMLVAGKAVSATHDALPAIRMQADLENLGGVCALAAASAVRSGSSLRGLDITMLQRRLTEEGLLPEGTHERRLAPHHYSETDLEQLVGRIEADMPLYDYANMRMDEIYRGMIPFAEIVSAGPRIVPHLEQALARTEGTRQIRIAQALAMAGSSSGSGVLIQALMQELSGPELPVRTANMMYVQLPPDHGAMPDAAYLLYSLAQTKDPGSIAVWQRVAELLQPDEADFKDSRKGIYYFIDAVCQGAERLADPAAVPVLEQLHRIPAIHGQQCYQGYQPDYFLERRAMLELSLGRALAACGSPAGYAVLIGYLPDVRSLLSKQAHLMLKRLSGRDLGKDPLLWSGWLAAASRELPPYSLDMPLDLEKDSERVLRQPVPWNGQ
ncbi:flavin-dependent dehydrogenase [Paenibacillus rhizosphaerae]|uniref:Flavin-dependent dehydrogenase n=1 Tax=Paenibacillus rhizosphaerae TaxID=297318 RepID=A0A839TW50_9BACL|nr:FAD-dependent oxidoreductase [Paenibacillus rhizosphaerae]MBB3131086.1 flavin-dependent dehydrogenase [Paenibacillus rhizosphaerae]